jgi:hypothetical protein
LLLWVKLDVVTLTCFPMDMILGIFPGESYNDICALVDLSVCVKYTNKCADSYVWVLQAFLKAMCQKKPQPVITNGD